MSDGALDFDAFFTAVHRHAPFPWQSRLAHQVTATGRWPALLDLPTGTGKTAAIDIALFALAQRPDAHPRRIVMVVDRRVVVDQAAARARAIREALAGATSGPLAAMRARLQAIYGGDESDAPVSVSVLRGGMPRDELWARRPDVPAVVVSTVDQVGSRLLFRGYGVSETMAPIHAGLLGNDCLFLLDEVQLSTAFAETLHAIHSRWRGWHAGGDALPLPDRWGVVAMSATPIGKPAGERATFRLAEDDRVHPVVARRLAASKRVALAAIPVKGQEPQRQAAFVDACCTHLEGHLDAGAVTCAVVVNRVATAREVHRHLERSLAGRADCVLLTGRMRPLDREHILGRVSDDASVLRRISAGRAREAGARPLVVVATQSIEAGADFDFDALVTECASLDALRQRFGRLDRLGDLERSQATVIARSDQIADGAEDVIYGTALAATWRWLETQAATGALDFGITRLAAAPTEVAPTLQRQPIAAPVLLPAHLDAWAQTNPLPYPDPDVALWLHGPDRGVPEVQVVWRADVHEDDLVAPAGESIGATGEALEGGIVGVWAQRFALLPPSSLEAMPLPLPAVRAWLSGGSLVPIGDVEGQAAGDEMRPEEDAKARPCLHVARDGVAVIAPAGLKPGMTIVVPASYGGIAAGNWDPDATAPVGDCAELATLLHRGQLTLRLDPVTWTGAGDHPADAVWRQRASTMPVREEDQPARAFREDVASWLHDVAASDGPIGRSISRLLEGGDRRAFRLVDIGDDCVAFVATRRLASDDLRALLEEPVGAVVAEDDESGSFTGENVSLSRHLSDVAMLAERFGRHLGLPGDVVAALRWAGALHDIGKADPRFQRWLAGGSEVRLALQDALLAKSSGEAGDRASRQEARRRSGYPKNYRHELLSVAMLDGQLTDLAPACDEDLVLHLVASHHGWCRPLAPAADPGEALVVEWVGEGRVLRADAAHRLARIDSGIAERYLSLTETYGWWGLAWLEAILRLADHRASEGASVEPNGAPAS